MTLLISNRAYAKDELKDYYGAIEDYSKAIELDPDYAMLITTEVFLKMI